MKLSAFVLVLACSLGLSACGIKPKHVQPPEHVEHDNFPREYPAPELNHK